MGTIQCQHVVHFNGSVHDLIEAVDHWAFDNNFHIDETLPSRIRLRRHRAKLSFLYSFNVLDYPLQLIVKIARTTGTVEVHAEADLTGTIWTTRGDRRKLEELSHSLASAIRTIGTDSNSKAHEDYRTHSSEPQNSHSRPETDWSILLRELGFTDRPTRWQEVEARYRELVRKYHPDRYASQNLPPEMIDAATYRFKQIVAAYETLKNLRDTHFS